MSESAIWCCSNPGCSQTYKRSSGRSIRKHFLQCFRATNRASGSDHDSALSLDGLSDDQLSAMIAEFQDRGEIATGLRRWRMRAARRSASALPDDERWTCPFGCGKHYRSTSSRSIHRHVSQCQRRRQSNIATHPNLGLSVGSGGSVNFTERDLLALLQSHRPRPIVDHHQPLSLPDLSSSSNFGPLSPRFRIAQVDGAVDDEEHIRQLLRVNSCNGNGNGQQQSPSQLPMHPSYIQSYAQSQTLPFTSSPSFSLQFPHHQHIDTNNNNNNNHHNHTGSDHTNNNHSFHRLGQPQPQPNLSLDIDPLLASLLFQRPTPPAAASEFTPNQMGEETLALAHLLAYQRLLNQQQQLPGNHHSSNHSSFNHPVFSGHLQPLAKNESDRYQSSHSNNSVDANVNSSFFSHQQQQLQSLSSLVQPFASPTSSLSVASPASSQAQSLSQSHSSSPFSTSVPSNHFGGVNAHGSTIEQFLALSQQ